MRTSQKNMAFPFLDLLKGCFQLAKAIHELVKYATFLRNQCEHLSDHVAGIVKPLKKLKSRQYDQETSEELRDFLERLEKALEDSKELIYKCGSKSILKSLTKKASYTEKFARLEKKLEHLTLPAALLNLVCTFQVLT